MSYVATDEGEVAQLSIFLGKSASENMLLKLYTTDVSLTEAVTAASFTEATGYGYSAKTILPADWTVVAGDPTYATAVEQVFTFTGALGAVYGCYLVGASSNKVYVAQRFDNAPRTVANNNDQIRITPRLGLE